MAGCVSNEKISEIQRLTNIVEVINRHVNLKRAGKNYIGLCPFHSEKTPSFSVSPEKQLYKCFGCGEGGTVFTFLMKKEGLSFPEALRILAERARVDIPKRSEKGNAGNDKTLLYDVNNVAAEFFHKCLLDNKGTAAREYLHQRGIKENSISKFRIGYTPDGWDSLIRLAKTKNIPSSRLHSAGLIIAKDADGGFYDRFRNRLMFPITDHIGRVIGFGGRSLSGAEPKYLTSPETILFSKGRCLYGLDLAKQFILKDRKALIMEGYTDVIVAHQEGICNAVGVLGTALTVDHIRLLRQWTPEVTLVLDGDTAGQKSSDRSLDILAEEEMEAKVVQLPEADDPCDFILREGANKFMELVNGALDFFGFKVQMAEAKWDLSSHSGKLAAIRELLNTVLKVQNVLRQQLIVKSIAEKMSVEEETLRLELGKLKSAQRPGGTDGDTPIKTGSDSDYLAERELLGLLLSHNELIREFETEVGPAAFRIENLKEIVHKALEIYHENGQVRETDLTSSFIGSEPAKVLTGITLEYEEGDYRKRFADCVYYVKRRENKKEISYTKERIRNLDINQKQEEATLLREFHEKTKLTHLSRKRGQ